MSAEVSTVYLYHAWCAECCSGSESSESEEAAEEWAAAHNAENHEEDDHSDSDYDHYRETLKEN